MTAIFINRMNNNYKLSEFELDADDVYEARCAEIFITLNHVLVFHCSFCDKKYGSFEYLVKHISIDHYGNSHEQEKNETNPVDNIQPDLDQVADECDNTHNAFLGVLDETLHEYTELQYTEKFKVEERHKSKISEEASDSEFPQNNEEYVEDIENVSFHIPHNSDETPSTDQTVEEKLSSGKRRRSLRFPSSSKVDCKTLMHTNADEIKSKPKKERKKGRYQCYICSKIFLQRYYLKKHLITHSSERKHKCDYCGFAFKDISNLKSHVRRLHIGQKNVSCEICSKKFCTKTESVAHMRTHTGEKPYICSFCGLGFQTSSRLMAHSKRHTEKPPLQCSYCEKEFWEKCEMKDHLLVHTKEKPFSCPICSARFPRRSSLRRHTKLHEK